MKRAAAAAMLMVMIAATARAADDTAAGAALSKHDVYVAGQGGYAGYRIPSLIVAPNGDLLAFCEGRKTGLGDSGNIDLLLRRSADGGKTWSAVQVVWDDGKNTCGNPCPVVDRDTGVIHLLVTWNRGDDNEHQIKLGTAKDTRRVFVLTSSDSGASWSKPRQITDSVKSKDWGWYATGPGAGIQLTRGKHRGRLVVPCDHSAMPWKGSESYVCHAIYSDDDGKTWHASATISPGVNECEVVELSDGRLMMNMRNYERKDHACRAVSISEDGGETWSAVTYDKALIEPICQGSIRRLRWASGDQPGVIVFSNPASVKGRKNLTVRASMDDGATWPLSRVVEPGSSAYSCLAATPGGKIGDLYEADGYKKIVYVEMGLDQLRR